MYIYLFVWNNLIHLIKSIILIKQNCYIFIVQPHNFWTSLDYT